MSDAGESRVAAREGAQWIAEAIADVAQAVEGRYGGEGMAALIRALERIAAAGERLAAAAETIAELMEGTDDQ